MPVETTVHTTLVGQDEPIEELPAEIISYSFKHNAPGSVEFKLSVDHPKCRSDVVAPNKHEVVITRNRMVVWRGPILTADEDDKFVTFRGEGLFGYTKRMFLTTGLTFNQVDQLAIARSLLNHHLNKSGGDFGLNVGTGTSGVLRDRSYVRHKNIYEALVELSAVENGFDLHVDPETRTFKWHYPRRGRRRPEIVLDERNIREFGRTVDGTNQASQVLGEGAGEGIDMLTVSRQSAPALAAYGLTQGMYVNKDVSRSATLLAHTDRELETRRDPSEIPTVKTGGTDPNPMTVVEGDEIRVKWPSPYEPVNRFVVVEGRQITWEEGEETVSWTLNDL